MELDWSTLVDSFPTNPSILKLDLFKEETLPTKKYLGVHFNYPLLPLKINEKNTIY